MNRLSNTDRAAVVRCLVEGMSIRATVRMTGIAKNTIVKLLVDLGAACEALHDRLVVGLKSERVQCDEIWSFCYAKAKNVPDEKKGQLGYGDVWTWTAIDADSKLCVSWLLGRRNTATAVVFMKDVAGRLANRVQLTTDGHRPYLSAVDAAFANEIDFATLTKLYGNDATDTRYSPPVCIGIETNVVSGDPDPKHISTSHVERQNLTMRMSMRRFTRLTNGFSKKLANLEAAVALHFAYYNFVRRHQSLRVTPAMAAGITNRLWSIEDLVALLDEETSN